MIAEGKPESLLSRWGKENCAEPRPHGQAPSQAAADDIKFSPPGSDNKDFFTPEVAARGRGRLHGAARREGTPYASGGVAAMRGFLSLGHGMLSPEIQAAEAHLEEARKSNELQDTALRLKGAQEQLQENQVAVEQAKVALAERVQLEERLAKALEALKQAEDRKRHVESHLQESLSSLEGARKSTEKAKKRLRQEQQLHNGLKQTLQIAATLSAPRPRVSATTRLPIQDQLSAVRDAILCDPDSHATQVEECSNGTSPESGSQVPGVEHESLQPAPCSTAHSVKQGPSAEVPASLNQTTEVLQAVDALATPLVVQKGLKASDKPKIWEALDAAEQTTLQDVEGLTVTVRSLLDALNSKRQDVAASMKSISTVIPSPLQAAGPLDLTNLFGSTLKGPACHGEAVDSVRRSLAEAQAKLSSMESLILRVLSKAGSGESALGIEGMPGSSLRERYAAWAHHVEHDLTRLVQRMLNREQRVVRLKSQLQQERAANKMGAEAVKQAKRQLQSVHGHFLESPVAVNSPEAHGLQTDVQDLRNQLSVCETERAAAVLRATCAERHAAWCKAQMSAVTRQQVGTFCDAKVQTDRHTMPTCETGASDAVRLPAKEGEITSSNDQTAEQDNDANISGEGCGSVRVACSTGGPLCTSPTVNERHQGLTGPVPGQDISHSDVSLDVLGAGDLLRARWASAESAWDSWVTDALPLSCAVPLRGRLGQAVAGSSGILVLALALAAIGRGRGRALR